MKIHNHHIINLLGKKKKKNENQENKEEEEENDGEEKEEDGKKKEEDGKNWEGNSICFHAIRK